MNQQCQAFLAWVDVAGQGPGPDSSGATRPGGSLRDAGKPRPSGSDLLPPPSSAGSSEASAVRQPPRVLEPPPLKAATEPASPRSTRAPLRYEFVRERRSPVAVQPLEESQPEAPLGESAINGKHGLWLGLDQRELAIVPGNHAVVSAQILNKGTIVEGVDMRVLGVPAGWVRIEPPRVNLDVGGQATMAIHFAPPREPATTPGPAEVEIAVWSASNPQVRCAQHVRLDVGAFHSIEVESPPGALSTRRNSQFVIGLRNNGNYPLGAGAQPGARYGAGGKVLLQFEQRSVALPPGGTGSLKVRARAAKWLISGAPLTHDLGLHVLGGGEAKPVDVSVVQQPLLPRWAPKVLRIAVPLLIAVFLALGISWWKNRPHSVPNVVGQQAALAQAQLGKAGFKSVQSNVADSHVPQGMVVAESPAPGKHLHHGAIVSIKVSTGPPQIAIGDFTQLPEAQARSQLIKQGLKVTVLTAPNPNVPAGIVTGQRPAQGTSLALGATVTITVSSGNAAVSVPSIRGLTEADAIALLGQVNLRYAKGGTVVNRQLSGQVVSQTPAPGAKVPSGSQVTAIVAVSAATP
jgi:beta-lactam-binding protein with PASTA domain